MTQRIREMISIEDALQIAREYNMYLAVNTDTTEGDGDETKMGTQGQPVGINDDEEDGDMIDTR